MNWAITYYAEIAERMGTTQSAVARLESGRGKHSPSLATLRKYARALGYRVDLRLVQRNGECRSTGSNTALKPTWEPGAVTGKPVGRSA